MTESCQGCDRVAQYINGIITTEPALPMAVVVMLIDADGHIHSLQRTRSDVQTPLGDTVEVALEQFFDAVSGFMSPDDVT